MSEGTITSRRWWADVPCSSATLSAALGGCTSTVSPGRSAQSSSAAGDPTTTAVVAAPAGQPRQDTACIKLHWRAHPEPRVADRELRGQVKCEGGAEGEGRTCCLLFGLELRPKLRADLVTARGWVVTSLPCGVRRICFRTGAVAEVLLQVGLLLFVLPAVRADVLRHHPASYTPWYQSSIPTGEVSSPERRPEGGCCSRSITTQ